MPGGKGKIHELPKHNSNGLDKNKVDIWKTEQMNNIDQNKF